jgi:hypothetical protein
MAHFALLDENNTVLRVEVVSNDVCQNEVEGVTFLQSLYGSDKVFKQTSYNGNIRKNYAGVGYTYDAQKDAFIPPKPYPSWILNDQTCLWGAPVKPPIDGKEYVWDEQQKNWIEV